MYMYQQQIYTADTDAAVIVICTLMTVQLAAILIVLTSHLDEQLAQPARVMMT
jgi:hypothetical protein